MHLTLPMAAVLLFLVTLMFLAGLELTPGEVIAATLQYGLLARALVVNLLVFPILALLLTMLIRLPAPIAIGILLMAASAGVPFLPRMARVARGNVVFAVGLMIVLQVASMVVTPITLNLILPGDAAVRVPIGRAVITLVLFQLLPLGLGVLVRHRAAPLAGVLAAPMKLLYTLGFLGTIMLFIVPHLDVLGQVAGGGALACMLLLTIIAWPIGWSVGGTDVGVRRTLAIGTSLRNIGFALLIATQDFPETGVTAVVGSYLLIQAVANFGFAKYVGRAPKPGVAQATARPS